MNGRNLNSFNVIDVLENEYGDYQIQVENAFPPVACHACGCVAELQKFGVKNQLFMDTPMHGKRVGLKVKRQRYRCKNCQTTFLELLDEIDDKRLATKRLIDYIEKKSLKHTFTSIADEVGMNEKTIRNIFRDYINRLEENVCFETPKWLRIDDIDLLKKPRCVIANIEHTTIVDMLTNRNKDSMITYLMNLPNRKQIRYVSMDMWNPYREAVRQVLPQAKIVVDKFHIVTMANNALEDVRKSLRASITIKEKRKLTNDRYILLKRKHDLSERELFLLELWTENYPMLKTAYKLKEGFYDIWDSQTKEMAKVRYEDWKKGITEDVEEAFTPIINAMNNWEQEVFSYFDYPITNAYTEAFNSFNRIVNRLGRGYSFEALRAEILFAKGVHKEKMINDHRHTFGKVVAEAPMMYYGLPNTLFKLPKGKSVNYGVDILTLVSKLEDGDL